MGFGSYCDVVSPTNLKKSDSVAPVRKFPKPRYSDLDCAFMVVSIEN